MYEPTVPPDLGRDVVPDKIAPGPVLPLDGPALQNVVSSETEYPTKAPVLLRISW